MKSSRVSGKLKDGSRNISVNLPIIVFEEEGLTFVYTPLLDLTGYGTTEAEAKSSFSETLAEFLRYTTTKGTLHEVLNSLGWKVSRHKKTGSKAKPPSLIEMLNSNEYLARIFEEKQYKKAHERILIPA